MQRITKARSLTLFAFLLLSTVGVQFSFFLLQGQAAQTTETSLRALLRNDTAFTDTLELTRQIDDLESIGLFSCSVFTRIDPGPFIFLDNRAKIETCNENEFLLGGTLRSVDLLSINGSKWRFEFVSKNHASFYLSLWLARLFVGLLVLFTCIWYWNRIDAKSLDLAKEEENNRILESRIRAQAELIVNLKVEAAVQQSLTELAAQVSHDIRSPLSALNVIVKCLPEISKEKRQMIEQVSSRIAMIASDLLSKYKHTGSHTLERPDGIELGINPAGKNLKPTRIADLLRSIYDEKKFEFGEVDEVDFILDLDGAIEAVCKINVTEFTRALSNLVNNAVESIVGKGRVTLALRSAQKDIAVVISDNGKGIPESLLTRLGTERLSYGKEATSSGSGLGVLQARKMTAEAEGKFLIQSRIGKGTIITLQFPRFDHR